MNAWRPEHAAQVLTAYDVLRSSPADASPADVLYRGWYAVRPPRAGAPPRWAAPVAGTARAAHEAAVRWSVDDTEVVATGIAGVAVVATATGRRALCRGSTSRRRAGPASRRGSVTGCGCSSAPGPSSRRGGGGPGAVDGTTARSRRSLVRVYLRPDQGEVGRVVHAVTSALAEADEWLLKVATTTEEARAAGRVCGLPRRAAARGAP